MSGLQAPFSPVTPIQSLATGWLVRVVLPKSSSGTEYEAPAKRSMACPCGHQANDEDIKTRIRQQFLSRPWGRRAGNSLDFAITVSWLRSSRWLGSLSIASFLLSILETRTFFISAEPIADCPSSSLLLSNETEWSGRSPRSCLRDSSSTVQARQATGKDIRASTGGEYRVTTSKFACYSIESQHNQSHPLRQSPSMRHVDHPVSSLGGVPPRRFVSVQALLGLQDFHLAISWPTARPS